MKNRTPIGISLIFLGVLLVSCGGGAYAYQGSLIEPPVKAAEFSLTYHDGMPFTLSDQRGKVVLIFFGYVNCPDVCPTTLSDFKRVHEALGEQAGEVKFVFITVDPERDTPEMLADYAAAFNTDFIGLGGRDEDLRPVWDAYYVVREKIESESALGYLMEHSARVMVIDRQGDLRMTFPFGMSVEAMTQDIQHLLDEE